MKAKNYNIKVYTLSGAYVRTFSPSYIMSGVSFSAQIWGGQGELRMKLNLPYASTLITYNQVIQVYESDDSNPNGRRIYTGIVWSLNRVSDSGSEYIEVRAVGIASMLTYLLYDQTWPSYVFNKNQDASLIAKDIIDRLSLKYPALITYDGTSVETSGVTANLAFNYDKQFDALKKVTDAVPNFWWSIDGTWKLQFHPRTGATGQIHHKVDFWTEVFSMTIEENTEKLVNRYILTYSGGSTLVTEDTTSQTAYGIRELRDDKQDINNLATAQSTSDAYIAKNKSPTRRITLVISSEYDFESIRPGDLITVRNIDVNISSFQINRIEYNPDQMKLELEYITSLAQEIFIS